MKKDHRSIFQLLIQVGVSQFWIFFQNEALKDASIMELIKRKPRRLVLAKNKNAKWKCLA